MEALAAGSQPSTRLQIGSQQCQLEAIRISFNSAMALVPTKTVKRAQQQSFSAE
jgi:hypothetical protein